MSQLRVDTITGRNGTDPVSFPSGFVGDASGVVFDPKIVSFSPASLSTNNNINTTITIVFDQTIQFSGVGTIYLRSGSSTGTIVESYTCGVSTLATISGQTLSVTPASSLSYNTNYYLTLPSAGIANTLGTFFKGSNTYTFQTRATQFEITGGTYTFTQASPTSPTGYYRYHIFSGTSPFTLSAPSPNATDLALMMIGGGGGGGNYPAAGYAGGGGGGGGLITATGPTWALSAGTYVMTVGAGGQGSGSPSVNTNGGDTTITPPTSPTAYVLRAYGGGAGGYPAYNPTVGDYSGNSGGSGGGAYSIAPTTVTGAGTPGQGNPGGYKLATNIPIGYAIIGAGGGGAGGAGGNATNPGPQASGPYRAGNGGNGLAVPQFPASIFAQGNIPLPVMPIDSINRTNGVFAGGGGGGMSVNYGPGYAGQAGAGGPGGGGHGARYNPPQGPITFPGPFGNPTNYAQNGATLSGGGGGGSSYGPAYYAGNGGSGVAMIRYAVPVSLI